MGKLQDARRQVDLDGVRGLAILLVLAGHGAARFGISELASAGVTLFFELSGYLITGILMCELDRNGAVNLKRFYKRRFTRLAPPMFFMVVVILIVDRSAWKTSVPALTWTTNYVSLLQFSAVEPFSHPWSLGVEEQFYLVWPVLLAVLACRRSRLLKALVALFVLLIAWRTALVIGGHVRYNYFALETAGSAMIAGALVALAKIQALRWVAITGLAGIFLGCVLAMAIGGDSWMVTPLLVTLPSMALVSGSQSLSWLTWRPLVFLGRTSYSLYLWHDPVSRVMFDALNPVGVLVGIAVGFVAYWLFEAPLMRWRDGRSARIGWLVQTCRVLGLARFGSSRAERRTPG